MTKMANTVGIIQQFKQAGWEIKVLDGTYDTGTY